MQQGIVEKMAPKAGDVPAAPAAPAGEPAKATPGKRTRRVEVGRSTEVAKRSNNTPTW